MCILLRYNNSEISPQISIARMPTTKSRSRTVSTDSRGSTAVVSAESSLIMECSDEELSPAQLNFYNKYVFLVFFFNRLRFIFVIQTKDGI